MQHQFTIRKGQIGDLAELKVLFVETIKIICSVDYDNQQIDAWASGVENAQRWDDVMSKQLVLVAQHENLIVGFATLDNGNYLDFLYVHKDYQRKGIAQLLLNKIEEEARRLKQYVLTSDVSKTAKPFFERMGFKILKEQINVRQGVELVNYKMTKQLEFLKASE